MKHTRSGKWPAIVLENTFIQLTVLPALGGKVVSIRSQATGREWLWRNPYLTLAPPPPDVTDYGPFDFGGWDEIFPTVAPCRMPDTAWPDRPLRDHGELWPRAWHVVDATYDTQSTSLTLAVEAPDLPFRFERAFHLTPTGPLEVTYRVTNLAGRLLPYLWAAHPLIAIQPGDELHLPVGSRMRSTGSVNLDLATDAFESGWPMLRQATGERIDMSRVPDPSRPFAVKLFVEATQAAIVSTSHAERLEITCSPPVQYIGLWLNYGAWSGAKTQPYFNLGIEPTTSPGDDLATLNESGCAQAIPPGATHAMSINVCLHGGM